MVSQKNQLNLLKNIALNMSGVETPQEIGDLILDAFDEILNYDGATISFFNKSMTNLNIIRAKKINVLVMHYIDEHLREYAIWLKRLYEKNNMEAIIWDDITEQRDVWFDAGNFRTFCWFPVIFHKQLVGSFGFIWENPLSFDRSCLEICSILSYLVGGELQRLQSNLQTIHEHKQRISVLEEELQKHFSFGNYMQGVVGDDPKMKKIYETIHAIADFDVNVLIEGETGVGKEIIADEIHFASHRRKGPFIKVNCGAISETLLESELFGHKKGAFTGAYRDSIGRFELAKGGTLFLDEISEMSLGMQVKLLRVLQQHTIERVGDGTPITTDVRIICATNKKLDEAVKANEFRQDLYYRLKVITICVPPLRERIGDLPRFLDYFIAKFNKRYGMAVKGVGKKAFDKCYAYSWPGNIRELENVIERVVITQKAGIIDDMEITGIRSDPQPELKSAPSVFFAAKGERIAQFEKEYIISLLKRNNGSITRSSQESGLNRKTLYLKMKQYKIARHITNE